MNPASRWQADDRTGPPEGRADDNGREQVNGGLARSQKSTLNRSGKKRQAPLSFPLKSTSFDEQKDATTGLSSRRTVLANLDACRPPQRQARLGVKCHSYVNERHGNQSGGDVHGECLRGALRRGCAAPTCTLWRPLKAASIRRAAPKAITNPAERKGVTDAFPARLPALEGSNTAEECLQPPTTVGSAGWPRTRDNKTRGH